MFTTMQSCGLAGDSRPLLQHEITLAKNPFATDHTTPAACAEAKVNATPFSQWPSFVLLLFPFLKAAEISPLQGQGLILRNWTMRRRYIPHKPPWELLLLLQCLMVPKCWIGSLDLISITSAAKVCTVWWVKQPNGFQNSTSDRCQQICCINEPHVISWFFLPEMETAHEWSLTFSLCLLAHSCCCTRTAPHHPIPLQKTLTTAHQWVKQVSYFSDYSSPVEKNSQLLYSLAVQHSPKSHVFCFFSWCISYTTLPFCSPFSTQSHNLLHIPNSCQKQNSISPCLSSC